MKKISKLFAMILCVISTNLSAQDKQDEIIGVWNTRDAQIEIYKADDKYIGVPIDSKGERYPERKILHLEHKNDKWVGKIYSRERNRSLDVICEVEDNKLLLEVSAGRISRNLEWTRAN
ncbi:hypothetical protein LVD17_24450 [Fulvivirga ulvae]|uniref:hypothetical protein n=1 Tax=Fulvivirga ulvae TaxID=2904245 RepID=UPI001F479E31|nr:hypothetical protein [Fulvivirga ulvae]UII31447.1 hypothetical protein LVD17_24450 [Fulvivirga ulvae]